MFLKNYTSEVPVSRTVQRIEEVLARCGVLAIEKEFSAGGIVSAVRFRIQDNQRVFTVRIPARVEKVQDALWEDYCLSTRNRRKSKKDFEEQAKRTAWRLMQEWVEIQMSMIVMKQAEPAEVFMPFVWDGQRTAFQHLKACGYRGLLPEHAETV